MITGKEVPDSFDILPGNSHPLGPTIYDEGVNFSLFSKHGKSVDILLFDSPEDIDPVQIIQLDPLVHKTYFYWHIFICGLAAGQLYAYRVTGPDEPYNGHRFNERNILLDPYSKSVAVPVSYVRNGDSPAMKSVVLDTGGYNWGDDRPIRRPFAQTVIYEMHVAGFTKHPNSGVSEQLRGTFAGAIEKIPYLQNLGITAVELLPVFQFDVQDCPSGKVNYWGYSPVSFFAPHHGYGTTRDPQQTLNEFRDMVRAFHQAGIEVILDVVFNHTAEGNENGPSFCFRGIDNSIYYILEEGKTYYSNYSGTGNTLNANQPIVRRMIIDSLHFWVTEMHVDGFRFDLASILSRDEDGHTLQNPPVLWDIETDPVLAGVKLIAEAWDAAGLYQVGSFAGDNWKEWNGRFRDDVRSFVKGDSGKLSGMVTRLVGSPDIYNKKDREPEQSINFVTCHDGFTLNDLVSYNEKHNEANGEDNRDGNNDNHSWNCGMEGPSNDLAIEALRNRQVKNFLCLTLISIGAPMILMGDEVRRTQQGNNNAYCQDNELSWFDWSLPGKYADNLRFIQHLISLRLQRDASQPENHMTLNELLGRSLINWHGTSLNKPDWSEHSRSIAFTVASITGKIRMHYMLNAYNETLEFAIPPVELPNVWKRLLDTSLPSPQDIMPWTTAEIFTGESYAVDPYSIAIFISYV
jgi:isoamylase